MNKQRTESALRKITTERQALDKSLIAMEKENMELYRNCSHLQDQVGHNLCQIYLSFFKFLAGKFLFLYVDQYFNDYFIWYLSSIMNLFKDLAFTHFVRDLILKVEDIGRYAIGLCNLILSCLLR